MVRHYDAHPVGRRWVRPTDMSVDEIVGAVLVRWAPIWLPGLMASETKQGKGYTAPKGRPTVHKSAARSSRRMSATIEWTLAIIVFLVVLAAVFYFGRGLRTAGGGGNSKPPADAPIVEMYMAVHGTA